ncbi:MAG: hypothetical protein PHF00_03930, partial [Elusimicrobia bacterium]|nr:hypothetical protein [Elusimicrobiota bacterium]
TPAAACDVSTAAAPRPARPGRLIIVGTAKLAQAQSADKHANLAFLMNLLEWSVQDEALLSIRSKAASYRPLRALPGALVLLVKYALVLFPPLALLAAGFWLHARRKARRRLLASSYDA